MWNSLPNDIVEATTINIFKKRLDKHWLIKMFFPIFMLTLLELEVYRFACDFYTIHDAGKEDYLCASDLIGLDGYGLGPPGPQSTRPSLTIIDCWR